MLILNSDQVRAAAPMGRVVSCLEAAFRSRCIAPQRQIVEIPGHNSRRLLLAMPAFGADGSGLVKLVTVCPENPSKGLPTIQGVVVVLSADGTPSALLDGPAVTHLRTGAASALASRYLSRSDSSHLMIVGTGSLAPFMAEAHCTVRPITRISVWGRRADRISVTAEAIRARVGAGVEVAQAFSPEHAAGEADIVSCSTSSAQPVVSGKWLKPGAFVDLVGSFSPSKREADDEVVARSRIFVDTFEGAFSEAGDILDPLSRGIITRERVEAEMADLVSGRAKGRLNAEEIIVFKSVGTAIEDLAVARMIAQGQATLVAP
jgi:ornithine cyclodeaminase/alanine dehydrogenase-like protein (mu-crystallin family)